MEAAMNSTRDKAQAFTKQLVGQMVGDDLLVQEGKEQEREADREPSKVHYDEHAAGRRTDPSRAASRKDKS